MTSLRVKRRTQLCFVDQHGDNVNMLAKLLPTKEFENSCHQDECFLIRQLPKNSFPSNNLIFFPPVCFKESAAGSIRGLRKKNI